MRPQAQGFDESLGFMPARGDVPARDDPDVVNAKLPCDRIDHFLWANLRHAVQFNGGQRFHPKGYMTDYFADEAIAAIEANRNRPFFMYLAFNAPHTPLQATKADYDALPQHQGSQDARLWRDDPRSSTARVGDVMAALKEQGIDDNTLVIFTSDNGGAWYVGLPRSQRALSRLEGDLLRRRHPHALLHALAGQSLPAARDAGPATHMDIFATAAAAGAASRRPAWMASTCCRLRWRRRRRRTQFCSGARPLSRRPRRRLEAASLGNTDPRLAVQPRDDPTERRNLSAQRPDHESAFAPSSPPMIVRCPGRYGRPCRGAHSHRRFSRREVAAWPGICGNRSN